MRESPRQEAKNVLTFVAPAKDGPARRRGRCPAATGDSGSSTQRSLRREGGGTREEGRGHPLRGPTSGTANFLARGTRPTWPSASPRRRPPPSATAPRARRYCREGEGKGCGKGVEEERTQAPPGHLLRPRRTRRRTGPLVLSSVAILTKRANYWYAGSVHLCVVGVVAVGLGFAGRIQRSCQGSRTQRQDKNALILVFLCVLRALARNFFASACRSTAICSASRPSAARRSRGRCP